MEDTRDFLSELDCFLQCVNEFDLDRKCIASSVPAAAEAQDTFTVSAGDKPAPTPRRNLQPELGDMPPHQVLAQPKSKRKREYAVNSTAEAPKKRNQNGSRKRQREEIEHLRVSAQKLQHELETLLGCDSSDGSPTVNANGESRQPGNKELRIFLQQTLAWKRAASSEKQQSEQAAVENLKLRAIVEENLVVCKNLRETTSKSQFSKIPGGLRVPHARSSKYPAVPREVLPDESAIFAALRQGLDAQYQRVSTVWDECNFKNSDTETRQPNRLKCGGENNFYLEHVRSRAFPFSANAVSRAIWKRTKGGILTPNMGELKIRQATENTVYATLEDTVTIPDAPDSTIRMWITLKRFIQAQQIVTVWQARVDIEHSTRIRLTESGWNVVKSIRKVGCGLNMAPCISQTCIRSAPDQSCGAIPKEEFADGGLNAKVVAQYHENMSMLNQTIENYLIDESLARGSGGRTFK